MNDLGQDTPPSATPEVPSPAKVGSDEFPPSDDGWLARAGNWIDIIAKVALMAGAVVAYLEYRASVETEKSKQAFELVKNWESERFQDAHFEVRDAVRDTARKFQDAYGQDPDRNQFEKNFFVRSLGQKIADNHNFEISVQDLFYFYSKVGLCVEQSLCSEDVLTGYFQNSAEDFYDKFEFVVEMNNDSDPEFANYIRSFIGQGE